MLGQYLFLSLVCILSVNAHVFAQDLTPSESASFDTLATHWECSLKGVGKRKFELVYHVSGKKVPCQVNYQSADSPGEIQVLWQAEVQRYYCEKMLIRRVEELRRQGWDCRS
jgi:hypothetical protein